ncbi:hypothetical protein CVT26_006879 [Gymnopilus dilepis]|uniref:GST N-terminal domain-containing protein n=1 Tax=Gymnopilus dilepis TaxID=231916 RepID=A0A409W0T2_9AGAR|nr:hypothetical protein CVT26_006879 [Gymnopilus dilepis]
MKLIFYDIPSRLARKAWSPNTWKTRYCLNYKGIPYQTEWVEYPDIEPLYKEIGLQPTSVKPDGTPRCTLPAIHDPSTGVKMGNSFDIAEYLDQKYPNSPRIFPHNSAGIQAPFAGAFAAHVKPIWNFLVPPECEILNPRSAEWFRQSREKEFGVARLEDITPTGDRRVKEWKKVERGFAKIDAWYAKNGGSGPFIWATPCWADFVVGGYLAWIRAALGEESEEWRDFTSWHGGRWKALAEGLKKYEEIH